MSDRKEFLKEAKEVRNEFVKIAGQYSVGEHLELRTEIDTLLIMYDQACERVRVGSKPETSESTCNLQIVRVSTWENASESDKLPFIEKAIELTQDTMFCTRVWSAWGYGTMTEDDFLDATGESEFIDAIAEAIWQGY